MFIFVICKNIDKKMRILLCSRVYLVKLLFYNKCISTCGVFFNFGGKLYFLIISLYARMLVCLLSAIHLLVIRGWMGGKFSTT